MWLPILYPKTQDDQFCWTLDAGEQVKVLLDAQGEDGVILGAIYSDVDIPPTSDSNILVMRFKSGAIIEIDRNANTLNATGFADANVQANGSIKLKAGTTVTVDAPNTEFTGNVLVKKQLTYEGGLAGSGGDSGSAIRGKISVVGDISVEGNIDASGTIMDGGGNSNHHSH